MRSRLGKISITRPEAIAEKAKEDSIQVSAGLKEFERTASELCLKCALPIGRGTCTQTIELHGEATVTFSSVSESELRGSDVLYPIVSSIFGDNYDVIYLLSGAFSLNHLLPDFWKQFI